MTLLPSGWFDGCERALLGAFFMGWAFLLGLRAGRNPESQSCPRILCIHLSNTDTKWTYSCLKSPTEVV